MGSGLPEAGSGDGKVVWSGLGGPPLPETFLSPATGSPSTLAQLRGQVLSFPQGPPDSRLRKLLSRLRRGERARDRGPAGQCSRECGLSNQDQPCCVSAFALGLGARQGGIPLWERCQCASGRGLDPSGGVGSQRAHGPFVLAVAVALASFLPALLVQPGRAPFLSCGLASLFSEGSVPTPSGFSPGRMGVRLGGLMERGPSGAGC